MNSIGLRSSNSAGSVDSTELMHEEATKQLNALAEEQLRASVRKGELKLKFEQFGQKAEAISAHTQCRDKLRF